MQGPHPKRSAAGWLAALCAGLVWVLATLPLAAQADPGAGVLLVYLPEGASAGPAQLAQAADQLARELAPAVPGGSLEAKIFRRHEDAEAFVREHAARIVLLLVDAPFLLATPDDFVVDPALRFVRRGREQRRYLLLVRADAPWQNLAGLAGRTLTVVPSAGAMHREWLTRVLLPRDIDPARHFGRIDTAVDDPSALANVQFGSTDAALVADDNPQLANLVPGTLRVVHTTPAVSLPVLAVRRGALGASEREALARIARGLAQSAAGGGILSGLAIDELRPVAPGERLDRATLLALGEVARPDFEIALPPAGSRPAIGKAPATVALRFVIELPLPEAPDPPTSPTSSQSAAASPRPPRP
jgi:hypothetical protein